MVGENFVLIRAWLEKQALGLLRTNDCFGVDVLSFYLFNAREKSDVIRAIKYLVDLQPQATSSSPFSLYDCAKMINGRLFKGFDPAILYYADMRDFLRNFLNSCLNRIYMSRDDGYSEKDWLCTEHALRVFVNAEDFIFLQTINEIILSIDEGKIKPSHEMSLFSKSMHRAALVEARDFLEEKKRKLMRMKIIQIRTKTYLFR